MSDTNERRHDLQKSGRGASGAVSSPVLLHHRCFQTYKADQILGVGLRQSSENGVGLRQTLLMNGPCSTRDVVWQLLILVVAVPCGGPVSASWLSLRCTLPVSVQHSRGCRSLSRPTRGANVHVRDANSDHVRYSDRQQGKNRARGACRMRCVPQGQPLDQGVVHWYV